MSEKKLDAQAAVTCQSKSHANIDDMSMAHLDLGVRVAERSLLRGERSSKQCINCIKAPVP